MNESRQRYGLLLAALAATFLFEGIAQPGDAQRVVATVLIGVTLMLALYAARARRTLVVAGAVAVGVSVVWVVVATAGVDGATGQGVTAIMGGLMIALAPPAVVIGVVRNIRSAGVVTLTAVSGVLCMYLLVGLFFAYTYVAMQNLGGAPFFTNAEAATSAHSVYFSFTTLTTIGYGDLTARSNLGHTLCVTEGLIGQIYLVTVVALFVGRLVPKRVEPSA